MLFKERLINGEIGKLRHFLAFVYGNSPQFLERADLNKTLFFQIVAP